MVKSEVIWDTEDPQSPDRPISRARSADKSLLSEDSDNEKVQRTQKLIIIASTLIAVIAILLLLGENYKKYNSASNVPQVFERDAEEVKKDVESYAAALATQVGFNNTST